MSEKTLSYVVAAVLSIAGAFAAFSLILAIGGLDTAGGVISSLAALGRYLFDTFDFASIYFPLFTLFCAAILLANGFPRRILLAGALAMIPVFTLALFLNLGVGAAQRPLPAYILSHFGYDGSSLFVGLLICFELFVIFGLVLLVPESARGDDESESPVPETPRASEPAPVNPLYLDAPLEALRQKIKEAARKSGYETGDQEQEPVPEVIHLRSSEAFHETPKPEAEPLGELDQTVDFDDDDPDEMAGDEPIDLAHDRPVHEGLFLKSKATFEAVERSRHTVTETVPADNDIQAKAAVSAPVAVREGEPEEDQELDRVLSSINERLASVLTAPPPVIEDNDEFESDLEVVDEDEFGIPADSTPAVPVREVPVSVRPFPVEADVIEEPDDFESEIGNISLLTDPSYDSLSPEHDVPREIPPGRTEFAAGSETSVSEEIPTDADPDDDEDDEDYPAVDDSSESSAGEDDDLVNLSNPILLDQMSEEQSKPPLPPTLRSNAYSVPVDGLLKIYPDSHYQVIDEDTKRAAEILRQTLEEFKIAAEVTGIRKGPVITMFEILPAPGVKLSKIVNLADNIALRLAASRVRIVAPIPGKHAVGIEVPNRQRAIVSFREMITDAVFDVSKAEIPVVLGKDITGDAQIVDLTQTPHLLIAGATGSGKSVCVNSLICSILYKRAPEDIKLILIDPKIVELKFYNDIPHLLTPVITDPKKAFQALQYCLFEMERRYSLLDAIGVRDIKSFNKKIVQKKLALSHMPYIVVIIDEFADLMATTGKELESTLARLAAMSRAVGIHIVLATQRPSIDVITGLIKANIPSRIAFMVAGKFDSRIIIDAVGAEKLLGKGDMLFTSSWNPFPSRIQGAFLSEEEVEGIVDHVKTLGKPNYIDDEIFIDDEEEETLFEEGVDDPLMDKATQIIVTAGKASASYLQRRLKIGYNRAARLVEDMERRGIVGPQNGSKPREVIHVPDRYQNNTDDLPGDM